MKILLDGSCEFIIGGKFVPNQIEGNIQFIDDEKKLALGKKRVEYISFFVQEDNGYERPNKFLKAYITKEDVLRLAKEIEKIEASDWTDEVTDDLPF